MGSAAIECGLLKRAAESRRHSQAGRQYDEKAQAVARQFKPALEKSRKEQPVTTLAGAAILPGALWKK
jgi:hypothetical protein